MITLTGLRKKFAGDVVALDGIDLHVPAGEIHGIVGRSGAGKSTLIRCLTALEKPSEGSVEIDGQEVSGLTGEKLRVARRRIGMVFQHVNLLDSRTAAGNIAHPLEVAGVPKKQRDARVRELLDLVGLRDRAGNYPAQLSGGQKQRVGIARALAAEPAVLLCDEPTSALDSGTTRQILSLIRDLRDRLNITVLIITHEMSVVREVCDSVTLLENGKIAESGSLVEVLAHSGSTLSKELIPLPPLPVGERMRLVEVGLGSTEDTPSATKLLALLADAGVGADIAAGTIETVGGRRVGRLQLEVSDSHDSGQIIELLTRAGVYAEVVA
ncbi:ATP-binding cassette domain-containing protein [Saxibacter everestensis]|uniref:ATP-binding cassette domain-containing protein n=1 Tax=Saxibacter everestensis TaxID=2909229 RepID=A0ABY8QQ77_9MICO|nr:ATP-binding cassette domain-containing protein [Brevibacteriaceae bacterium ZFBP1038]